MPNNIIDKIQLSGVTYDIGGQGSGVSVVEVTQAEYDALPSSAKTDTSKMYVITDAEAGDLTNYYTKTETNTLLGGKQDTLVSGTNIKTINNESILGSGNIDIQGGGGGKAISAGTNISVTTGETADTINCTLPITAETSSTKCIIKIGEHLNVSNGANHEWAIGRYNVTRSVAIGSWANSGNTAFSIGIGTPWNSYNGLEVRQNGDVYIADTRTGTYPYEYKMIKLQDAVAALDTKQTTLTAGTGIDITDNVISATGGGGGKTIEAGRGISVTTGATADTVSISLPIGAGTGTNSIEENNATSANGNYSHSEGYWTRANGLYSHAEGFNTTASGESAHAEGSATQANGISSHAEGASTNAKGNYSHTEGNRTIANNQSEHASGQYNVSSSASTTFGDSGNTLFSVGNGTSSSARHNAFEIRQNGDIYLTSGSTDIKLQDHLGGGGGGGVDVVQTTGTSTTDVMSQDAVTTQLNGKADKTTAARGLGHGNKNTHSVMYLTNQNGQEISGYYYTLSLSKINGKDIVTQGDVNPNTFSLVETSAITTSISSSSTDVQVPSAKAVYDIVGNIETLLSQI